MTNALIFADSRMLYNPLVDDANTLNQRDEHALKTLGPFRIATELRLRGFTCQVVHMMADFTIEEIVKLCEKFISSETLIVGFSTSFWVRENPRIFLRILKIIECTRSINPKTKIVFGGPNSLSLLSSHNYDIDAVILGYGEHGFIKYLNSIVDKKPVLAESYVKKIPVFNFVENSPIFNFKDSQTLYHASDCLDIGEPMVLEVGRGCIFKCKFCSYPLTGKKKLDHIKDPASIRDELIRNYNEFGIDKYIISDDTFNDSNEKLDLLHSVFTTLPFKLNFSAYLRLDLLNAHRGQIDKLLDMGLTGAFFGVESFHEKAARTIGKGIVSKVAKDLLYDLKKFHWKNNVKIQIGLITGLPYETLDSYSETAKWIRDEENCLVEKIAIAPLKMANPATNSFPWKSDFEQNPELYGYYWPNPKKIYYWKNDLSPVTDASMAARIQKKMWKAVTETCRDTQGGFNMYDQYHKTMYFNNKKTFEQQLSMDRREYMSYIDSESNTAFKLLSDNYKNKIFNV